MPCPLAPSPRTWSIALNFHITTPQPDETTVPFLHVHSQELDVSTTWPKKTLQQTGSYTWGQTHLPGEIRAPAPEQCIMDSTATKMEKISVFAIILMRRYNCVRVRDGGSEEYELVQVWKWRNWQSDGSHWYLQLSKKIMWKTCWYATDWYGGELGDTPYYCTQPPVQQCRFNGVSHDNLSFSQDIK